MSPCDSYAILEKCGSEELRLFLLISYILFYIEEKKKQKFYSMKV